MKIIDTHVHSWDLKKIRYDWMEHDRSILNRDYLPTDLEPEMKACHVEKVVLVQSDNSLADSGYMFDIAREHDWIAGVVAWLPLTDPAKTEALLTEKYAAEPFFRGIRHLMHIEPDEAWILQPTVMDSLALLSEHHITFDAIGINTAQLRNIITAAASLPDLPIVIDHLNQPPMEDGAAFREWSILMQEAAALPNLYAKISGQGTVKRPAGMVLEEAMKPAVDVVLTHFGLQRCFCGGDWPISLLDREYGSTWSAYVDVLMGLTSNAEDLTRLLYSNARDFYKLQDQP